MPFIPVHPIIIREKGKENPGKKDIPICPLLDLNKKKLSPKLNPETTLDVLFPLIKEFFEREVDRGGEVDLKLKEIVDTRTMKELVKKRKRLKIYEEIIICCPIFLGLIVKDF